MTRTLPMRQGGNSGNEFSPIPIKLIGPDHVRATDFTYGSTETKLLSEVNSRHKLAWLWSMVWEAINRLGARCPLRYHAALVMIQEHGLKLDQMKNEKGWEAILRGYRLLRVISLAGEIQENAMEVVYWDSPPEEGTLEDNLSDFALTAHDYVCPMDNGPVPAYSDLYDGAREWDKLRADELEADCEAMGVSPIR